VSTDDLAAGLEPGTTVLVLLLEHLWADAVIADIRALGGRCLTSRMLPADPMHDTDCYDTDC